MKFPSFASKPRSIDKGAVSAANTNRNGTGTIVTIATGSTGGFRVSSVVAKAEVTTTAGMIRLYISTDSGSTWDLFDELEVPAVTPSASISSARISRNYSDLILTGTTNLLGASTHNAEAFNVFALGADI